ncbi:hypothetical protein IGI04_007548 [Brassica rapa subsp. trilocularis]|uniref:Secreted protein n=1 Tax=Brassica rapa subsp. trilocularis TaxID=1813537 RepID=A0ABQ7NK42_BRACM|nr:hypothetical protein IGI04_007548 [Brassica rapa subsp. trilocularis]
MNLAGQALSLSLSHHAELLSLLILHLARGWRGEVVVVSLKTEEVRRRGAAVVVQAVSSQWTVKTKLYGRPV